MATDVEVQYFSHLNGLTLGNNWGDLIRLLDKALVTGIDFTQITAASIDAQGDVHITLYAAHNAMLFQVVELTGFAPASLNQKYRIKGVPSATELILKPKTDIVERTIITVGAGKLASLGYEIVFRDANDVKRVYRAKNPTAQHPFIRVDETISDGSNIYSSTYAKSAMVGLLESMSHIDDYANPTVLQLPFDKNNVTKNWKITGTGSSVVRGWGKWYWATNTFNSNLLNESSPPVAASWGRTFTLTGDKDAFYILQNPAGTWEYKILYGCGLFNSALPSDVIPNWFLMAINNSNAASYGFYQVDGITPIVGYSDTQKTQFLIPTDSINERIKSHEYAYHLAPSHQSGFSNLYTGSDVPALEIAFHDSGVMSSGIKRLRGSLKHIYYAGKQTNVNQTASILSERSMYVTDACYTTGSSQSNYGCVYFYLGELE
ncbi:MAG: hypothetical protein ACK4FN_01890 [Acinetobacter johnsonii]